MADFLFVAVLMFLPWKSVAAPAERQTIMFVVQVVVVIALYLAGIA